MCFILSAVMPFLGRRGEPVGSMFAHVDLEHVAKSFTLKAVEGSFRVVPWSGDGKYSVGEVLGEPSEADEADRVLNTRYIARKQLDRLRENGYQLLSAFEMEQVFMDDASMQPIFNGSDYLSSFAIFQQEKLIFDIKTQMKRYGVPLTSISAELSPGQVEYTMKPSYDIDCPDQCFRAREGLQEICHQKGILCSFMTVAEKSANPSGYHFNHSLWTADGQSAFFDDKESDKMSQLARYWIGGLQKHSRAMTALVCPTVNCYRRLNRKFSISHNGWALESRWQTYRMRSGTPNSTYLENRLPSSSANPYLVLAATVAAGLDGILKKIDPVQSDVSKEGLQELPNSLAEALEALEEDEVMVNAIGSEFIKLFCLLKRHHDLVEMDGVDVKDDRPEDYKRECQFYQR